MNSAETIELSEEQPKSGRKLNIPQFVLVVIVTVLVGLFLKHQFSERWIDFAGFVTGVLAVYLVSVEHIYNWPIGMANVSIFAYVYYEEALWADVTLQAFFFVLSIVGWHQWLHGGSNHSRLSISRIELIQWRWIAMVWLAGVAVYFPIVTYFKGSAPFIDSVLTVGSMIAQVLLNRKKIENWMIWIALDVLYVPLFVTRGYISFAVLYGFYLCLAISGLISWHRTYQKEQTA